MNYGESACKWSPDISRNEDWFEKQMKSILPKKLHIQEDLLFMFLDSWAKHPMNVFDENQKEEFDKESKQAGAELGQAQPLLGQSQIKTRIEFTDLLDVNLVFGSIWLGNL